MKLYLENLKHTYTVKPILTTQEVTELVTLAQPLGPDPSLENRSKSICYLVLDRDGLWRKLSYDYFTQHKIYNDNPTQGGLKRYYQQLLLKRS